MLGLSVPVPVWLLVAAVSDVSPVLLLAVSEADSVVKVAEWQQTYYSSDSGIQSGATTVRDDESSTVYSGRKKYTSGSSASAAAASVSDTAGGGGETAASALESPTGEMLWWIQHVFSFLLLFLPPPFVLICLTSFALANSCWNVKYQVIHSIFYLK